MKKYEKPAIEKINIGATMPLMASTNGGASVIDNTGFGVGDENDDEHFASGRKDKDYDEGW